MRGFLTLASTDLRLYVREPIAMFFTIAFAPLIVVLNGVISGNKPVPALGGMSIMDVAMPGCIAMIVCIVGLMAIPVTISTYRESAVLRRFRTTPLKPLAFIAADVVSNLLMTVVGVVVVVAFGKLVYNVSFGSSILLVALAVPYCALALFSVGYLIAAVAPTPRIANVVGLVVLYPMVFLSGAAVPAEVMPESVRRVAQFLPLTHAVNLLKGLWFGDPIGDLWVAVVVLGCVLVACTALAARLFRWE